MSTSGKPLQNILWLVGERVGRAAITATVLGVVARYLEPAGFGRLNFAIAVVTIGAALASFGLEGLVVSELIKRPPQAGAVLGTALRLRLVAGLFTAGLIVALGFCFASHEAPLLGIVALGLVFQPVEVVDLWFQRHLDSRRTVMARFAGVAAGATLKLWLVAADAPLVAFAWAQVADLGFITAALAWAGQRSPHRTGPWIWDAEIARVFRQRGGPLALSAVVVAFALKLDQLLVTAWLGEHAAGTYFAATRLTDMALFAGTATMLSLFPALAAGHGNSSVEFRARLQAMFDALSALGWIVALGCTLAAPWIVRLIYGPAYLEAVPVLRVLGWFCLVALNAGVRWNFILLSAPTWLNLAAALLHVGVLLGASQWLLPAYGTTGVALALLLAGTVSGYLTSFLFPPLRECAGAQTRGLLILFTPSRWRDLLRQFQG